MTAIINPSTAAIKAIAQIVAQRSTGDVPADAFVHAALSQVSLEDFELQDQQAWVKILESLLQVCAHFAAAYASARLIPEHAASAPGALNSIPDFAEVRGQLHARRQAAAI